MNQIIVIKDNGQESPLNQNELLSALQKIAVEEGQNNFSTEFLWEKTGKYLEIFLTGPQKQLTEIQLIGLLANICLENGFEKVARALQKIHSLAPGSADYAGSSTGKLTKNTQEKMKKLYLPPAQNNCETEILVNKIASHKTSEELTARIAALIGQNKFFPHQNVLKGPHAYESMQITLEDNLNDIFDQLKQAAINFQNLISTNLDFSKIRQKMAMIKSTRGFSSGPISFIKIYTSTFETLRQNLSTELIPQQSFTLSIHHPDILEYLIFIKNFQKNSLNKHLRFFIEISPQFLDALAREEDFELISPENGQTVNLLSAKNTFDLIVSTIVENPQLGIKQNKSSHSNFLTVSGLINLAGYQPGPNFPGDLLNDLKTIQDYLLKQKHQLEKLSKTEIHTVIFFSGWMDFLMARKIAYGSVNSIQEAGTLFAEIRKSADQSLELSINLHSPLLNLVESHKGLECFEQLATLKTNLDGQEIHQLDPILRDYLSELGMATNDITRLIYDTNSLNDLYQIPLNIRTLFKTSREIDAHFHLELQREIENILQGEVEKKIYFENPLDTEKLKETLLGKLKLGIKNIGYFHFGPVSKYQENTETDQGKNFLLTLNKNKKRRHREIQPPLFQIKKTEEIFLPPVSNQSPSQNQN